MIFSENRHPLFRIMLCARPYLEHDLWENIMSNFSSLSLAELEDRIAIARDNIRQLIEQAAAQSGAEDEDRNADRIAQQTEELEKLVKQRDALLKK
jgi:uncharacterized small protein (DUF1192 family)